MTPDQKLHVCYGVLLGIAVMTAAIVIDVLRGGR